MSSASWASLVGAVVVALGIVLRIVALGVIPGNRKPSSGMAWLLLIGVLPVGGYLVYGLLGRTELGRTRHERRQEVAEALRAATAHLKSEPDGTAGPPYLTSVITLNRRLGLMPALGANGIELQPDSRACVRQMADAVDAASEYVLVEFYISSWDPTTAPLFEAMVRAVRRGVAVRLLFDHLGSRGIPAYRQTLERLAGTGIEWYPMLPLKPWRGQWRRPDLRNHRKLLVVDGRVGFMGSMNLIEPEYGKAANHDVGRAWVDLMCRVEGPVVAALEVVFAGDWYTESGEQLDVVAHGSAASERDGAVAGVTCQLVPSGPGYPSENNLRLFTTLLYAATERISIASPYFVPDESLLYAVTTAAQRGIDVELFVSEEADQFMVGHAMASYYLALLDAGVRIWLYPAPMVLHSKHVTIDDDVAVLGSSNMDMRSFDLNYEISLMVLGPEIVGRMREVEDAYRERCRPLLRAEWERRPRRLRYVDNVMRLTASLQ